MERRLALVEQQFRLPSDADSRYDGASIISTDTAGSDNTIKANDSNSSSTTVASTGSFQHAFEEHLNSSWVYRRNQNREEDMSMRSSVLRLSAWSVLSDMSLANISIIAVMSLPVQLQELSNGSWYTNQIEPADELRGKLDRPKSILKNSPSARKDPTFVGQRYNPSTGTVEDVLKNGISVQQDVSIVRQEHKPETPGSEDHDQLSDHLKEINEAVADVDLIDTDLDGNHRIPRKPLPRPSTSDSRPSQSAEMKKDGSDTDDEFKTTWSKKRKEERGVFKNNSSERQDATIVQQEYNMSTGVAADIDQSDSTKQNDDRDDSNLPNREFDEDDETFYCKKCSQVRT